MRRAVVSGASCISQVEAVAAHVVPQVGAHVMRTTSGEDNFGLVRLARTSNLADALTDEELAGCQRTYPDWQPGQPLSQNQMITALQLLPHDDEHDGEQEREKEADP